ncbi:bacterioferritin, partial [Bordetella pertussis]
VCEVRSVAVPVNPPAALEPVGTPQPAANGFPIPLVAVA